jgi:N-ethylmaleimide reductase
MDLFSPVSLGDLRLSNRIVMAPMTRMRSGVAGVPDALVAKYYAQRASVGLIITEGTFTSYESRSYLGSPGIVTDEQQEGWRGVSEAVHARGGLIVMQLMHGGRASHTSITGTDRIVAPSPIAIDGQARTPTGKMAYPIPHPLTRAELSAVRQEFVDAAGRAIKAGFDGVELHSANGYFLHQFLSPASNQRDDAYGGTPERRARFVIEVARAVSEEIGAGRVGIRISPMNDVLDLHETDLDDVTATYSRLIDGIEPLGLAYLSALHREPSGALVQTLRERFGGPFIANSGFGSITTRDEALALVEGAHADAVAVGRLVLSTPDLVERWKGSHPENQPNSETYYGPGSEGYTDYPLLSA